MKSTFISKIAVLVLLFGIPFLIDGVLWLSLPSFRGFSMTGLMIKGYLGLLPAFICYLMIALSAIYLWNKKMKKL
jgi:hypothetical protein